MGRLHHLLDGTQTPVRLRTRHLVGRSPRCDLELSDPSVSGEHAVLTHREGRWWIRDLGSRNGTQVDGRALEPGESRPLAAGTRVQFAQSGPWSLVDAGPPGATVVALDTGEVLELDGGMLALPNETSAEALLSPASDGRWLIQRDAGDEPVTDGQVVEVGARRFRLSLPDALSATLSPAQAGLTRVDDCTLVFHVSLHEEAVELTLRGGGGSQRLPQRVHHYLLLHLSRLRREDAERGLPLPEQGWILRRQLASELRLGATSLNVQLYRARKQLADAGLIGAEDLIERRGREIRIARTEVEEQPLGS